MKARKVAAQYAAYTWYQENHKDQQSQNEAIRFAKEDWTAFLSVADEGWGGFSSASPPSERSGKAN